MIVGCLLGAERPPFGHRRPVDGLEAPTPKARPGRPPGARSGKWTYRRCGRPDPQAQISASLGTRLCVISFPMRETFIRCLKSRFSEIELPP